MGNHKWILAVAAFVAIVGATPGGPSAAATLSQHGYWAVVADSASDGSPVCSVRTPLSNGAELRLVVAGPEVHLVASDPSWLLRPGEAQAAVTVDSEVYAGTAAVAGPHTLVIESLTSEFLARFVNGTKMTADFGGVRWDVSLLGSGRAASALAACAATAKRELAS